MATEQEKQEIKNMLDQWGSAWAARDSRGVKALFDQQYRNLVYIAEETELPIVNWDGIDGYIDGVLGDGSGDSNFTYDNLVADVFGDTSYAQCTAQIQAGKSPRMEYVMRITFIFRKAGGSGRLSTTMSRRIRPSDPTATLSTRCLEKRAPLGNHGGANPVCRDSPESPRTACAPHSKTLRCSPHRNYLKTLGTILRQAQDGRQAQDRWKAQGEWINMLRPLLVSPTSALGGSGQARRTTF